MSLCPDDLLLPANPMVQRLRRGLPCSALIVKHARTPDIALAARSCGYDALYLDLQHSTFPPDAAASTCVAALGAGITPLVRVPAHDHALALRMLDAGALGVIFPGVDSAEQARAAVQACRFAPLGSRSTSALWPHFGYRTVGAAQAQTVLEANTSVIVMIESCEGLAQVEQIAAVPGVSVVHVGTGDLATAMGLPGGKDHPSVLAAVDRVVAACRAHNVVAGVGGLSSSDPAAIRTVLARGARFVTAGNEWALMLDAMRARAAVFQSAAAVDREQQEHA